MAKRIISSFRDPGSPNRPLMTRERITDLCSQIIEMTSGTDSSVIVRHSMKSFTRVTNGVVQTSNDGDQVSIAVDVGSTILQTDQVDPDILRALVKACENAQHIPNEDDEVIVADQDKQDEYVPAQLWHDSTIDAMRTSRATLLPSLLKPITQQGLVAAGYVGFYANAEGMLRKSTGIHAYYEETDCELSVSARTKDGTSSGWGGQEARDWTQVDSQAVTARAIDMAQRGINPKALEPGRRTAILTRDAVAQMARYFAEFYDAGATELEMDTPFWERGYPDNRIGEHVFDERITMTTDPGDADGGFRPYFDKWPGYSAGGYANPVMTWAKDGVLKNLAFNHPFDAVARRLKYSDFPHELRISGGETSIDQMIAMCKEGIYINHFANVDLVERKTGVMTGTTRDGCFFVKDGKIDTPVKNFRFIDSPMFMLNNIVALGESKRASYGYTPRGAKEVNYDGEWPRRPMIVPPMMVRDFNFTSLADAV